MLRFHVVVLLQCFAHMNTAISSIPESLIFVRYGADMGYHCYLICAITVIPRVKAKNRYVVF